MTTMERVLKFLGLLCFYFYLFLLVTYGLLGYFNPGFELTFSYHINWVGLSPQDQNSLFDHLRFLKTYVLGFATFGILFRRQIFEVRVYNRLFLGTLFISASGRLLTLVVNGKPCLALIWTMLIEYFFWICILAYSRITLTRAQQTSSH